MTTSTHDVVRKNSTRELRADLIVLDRTLGNSSIQQEHEHASIIIGHAPTCTRSAVPSNTVGVQGERACGKRELAGDRRTRITCNVTRKGVFRTNPMGKELVPENSCSWAGARPESPCYAVSGMRERVMLLQVITPIAQMIEDVVGLTRSVPHGIRRL